MAPHKSSRVRRFDQEHTFRCLKQTLGWNAPQIASPQTADIRIWLAVSVHTQPAPARELVDDRPSSIGGKAAVKG